MRFIFFCTSLLLMMVSAGCLYAQQPAPLPFPYPSNIKINYVRTWEPRMMESDTAVMKTRPAAAVRMSTKYFDGLGRLLQTVVRQGSPQQIDVVTAILYDSMGRTTNQYLPFPSTPTQSGVVATDGSFKLDPFSEQKQFYQTQFSGETFYYMQTKLEASPMGRPMVHYNAGNSWVGAQRGISQQYEVNSQADSVLVWGLDSVWGALPKTQGIYFPGQLFKNITTDETGHRVVEYKDKEGMLILKKVQLSESPGTAHIGWLCTYYVYDDWNNLRFVIPPQAVALTPLTLSLSSVSQAVANELCFRYEYDQRNRMMGKKIPGAGEIWIVYDARDRLVMSQDSNMRVQGKWLVNEYDSLNRPYRSGLLTDAHDRAYHQNLAYSSSSYPNTSSGYEVLKTTYYDDYAWAGSLNTGAGTSGNTQANIIGTLNVAPDYAVSDTPYLAARGLTTGSMTKVLGPTNNYLYAVHYYDNQGRVVQTQSTNITGAVDTLTAQYSFSGKPLRQLLNHGKAGNTPQHHDVFTKLSYDAGDRLKTVTKSIDGVTGDQLIDSMQYDELDQLRGKYFGGGLDSLIYDYNIRGWMTGINKKYVAGGTGSFFGMELAYDNASSVTGASYVPQYNGTIAGLIWKTKGDSTRRKYDFTYDNINRMTGAAYTQNPGSGWSNSLVDYSVSNLSYDANGNILSMNQQGFKWNGSALIDQLTYSYKDNSNKLRQVGDAVNDPLSKLGDFHFPGTKDTADYWYDGNGNLVIDNNKAIDKVIYNHLNLPQQIHINGKGNVLFTYDAAGEKLSKVVMDSLTRHATTTTYINDIVYQHSDTITNPTGGTDTLQYLLHEEGRARWALHYYQNGTKAYGWEDDFFEKDHLGNTRMILTTQRDTSTYLATMEGTFRAKENALFYNIPTSAYSRVLAGYPVDLSTTNPNDSVIALNGTTGRTQGPAIILKVMAGDVINVGAKSYYNSQSSGARNTAINDLLTSLATGVVGLTGGGKGTVGQLNTPGAGPLYGALNSFVSGKEDSIVNKPRAYLNYMFLDNQYQYDAAKSGAVAVGNYPAGQLNSMAQSNIVVGKSGFLYVWVSAETQGWPVFFDNLSVQVQSGPVLEETHYYPFGLTMAGISDKALKGRYVENKYRFDGGAELQNKEFADGSGLDMYATHFRALDPQLGRWWQIDPKPSDMISPYSAMDNDPMRNIDLLGDTTYLYDMKGVYKGVIYDELKTNEVVLLSDKNLNQALQWQKDGTYKNDDLAGKVRDAGFAGARITGKTIEALASHWRNGQKYETGGYLYIDAKTKEVKISVCESCGLTMTSFSMDKLRKTWDEVSKKGQIIGVWHTHPENSFTGSQPTSTKEDDYKNPSYGMMKGLTAVAMVVTKTTGTIYPSPTIYYTNNRIDDLVTRPKYDKDFKDFQSPFQYGVFDKHITPQTNWKK